MSARRVVLGFCVILSIALVVVVAVRSGPANRGSKSPQQRSDPWGFRQSEAPILLERARQSAPYALKLPTWLPRNFKLADAIGEAGGPGRFSLDVWYRDAGSGRVIHVWETNLGATELGKSDPTLVEGSVVKTSGGRWHLWQPTTAEELETRLHVMQLSRRFDDGVTVTIDAPLSMARQHLERVAASIKDSSAPGESGQATRALG